MYYFRLDLTITCFETTTAYLCALSTKRRIVFLNSAIKRAVAPSSGAQWWSPVVDDVKPYLSQSTLMCGCVQ